MTSGFALSPAIIAAVRPPSSHDRLSSASVNRHKAIITSSYYSRIKRAFSISRKIPKPKIRCDSAVKSSVSELFSSETEEDEKEKAKIGAKVRVTAPMKIYHVVREPEVELMGMEGLIKDYVVLWKGKRISANLPYKVVVMLNSSLISKKTSSSFVIDYAEWFLLLA